MAVVLPDPATDDRGLSVAPGWPGHLVTVAATADRAERSDAASAPPARAGRGPQRHEGRQTPAHQSGDRAPLAPTLPRRGARGIGGSPAVAVTYRPRPANRRARPAADHRARPGQGQQLEHTADGVPRRGHTGAGADGLPSPGLLWFYLARRVLVHWLPWPKARVGAPPEMLRTPPGEWCEDIAALHALVDRVGEKNATDTWGAHPVFGAISGQEWGLLCWCTAPGFLDTRLRYAAWRSLYSSRASSGVRYASFSRRQHWL